MQEPQESSNKSTSASWSWQPNTPNNWAEQNLTIEEAELVVNEWFEFARIAQYPLGGTQDTWLVVGGRGAGKTRLGAEWVNSLVRGFRHSPTGRTA